MQSGGVDCQRIAARIGRRNEAEVRVQHQNLAVAGRQPESPRRVGAVRSVQVAVAGVRAADVVDRLELRSGPARAAGSELRGAFPEDVRAALWREIEQFGVLIRERDCDVPRRGVLVAGDADPEEALLVEHRPAGGAQDMVRGHAEVR